MVSFGYQQTLRGKINLFTVTILVVPLLLCASPFTYSASALSPWQRSVKKLIRQDNLTKRSLRAQCSNRKYAASASSYCDFDGDGFVNFRERHFPRNRGKKVITNTKKIDTDNDGLTDYEELMRYGTDPRQADSDHDGLSDGDEVHTYGTDPLDEDTDDDGIDDSHDVPTGTGCEPPNFDSSGNTTSFGIPNGHSGNQQRGATVYAVSCQACHNTVEHGTNMTYLQIEAAITGATGKPMNILLSKQNPDDLSDLTAFLNRTRTGGTGNCATPTPPSGDGPQIPPTATATPTVQPTPTPCPGGSQNFDAQGNTSSFGIAPLTGNIQQGQTQYTSTCTACHNPNNGEKGTGYTMQLLSAAFMNNPFMNGTLSGPVVLNNQQIANLVAYLNRNSTGGCTNMGTPTPTPTPNPASQGAAIFAASCARCHINSQGNRIHMDSHPSKSNINEALWQGPDEMPTFRSLCLGPSGPPWSDAVNQLWAFLNQ